MVKGRHQRSKRKVSLKRIEKHVTDSKHVRSRTHRKESKRKISKGKSDQDSEIERNEEVFIIFIVLKAEEVK